MLLLCHGFLLVTAGVTRRRRRLWPETVALPPAVQHPALDAWSRAEQDFPSSASSLVAQPAAGSLEADCGPDADAGVASQPQSQDAASALVPSPDFELADHLVDLLQSHTEAAALFQTPFRTALSGLTLHHPAALEVCNYLYTRLREVPLPVQDSNLPGAPWPIQVLLQVFARFMCHLRELDDCPLPAAAPASGADAVVCQGDDSAPVVPERPSSASGSPPRARRRLS